MISSSDINTDESDLKSTGRPRGAAKISGVRVKAYLLLLLALAHIAASWFLITPGYLLIDEAVYHWTQKSFSDTGGFEVWTGYGEFPSLELAHLFFRIHDGRPVSQFPYLFPLLSLPLYRQFGYFGLFLVNAVSFVGVVLLCFSTARRLFQDVNLALNSCLILVLATFAWEYSQAAWPHITSILFLMGSFYLGVRAYYRESALGGAVAAFAGGLVAGFGTGIRIDCFLVIPCLLLPFLISRPWRPIEAVSIVLGSVPGLTVLAVTNYYKFGVVTPLSYGTDFNAYTPSIPMELVIAAGAAVGLVWMLTRTSTIEFIHARTTWLIKAAALTALIALVLGSIALVPQLRQTAKDAFRTFYESVVDMRVVDPGTRLPSMERSPGGGVVYVGALKKALLQSIPYLVILVIPLIRIARRAKDSPQLLMLFLVPASVVVFYSFFKCEYGGLCLNYRYFLPILPFTSILVAYSIRELARDWGIPFSLHVIAAIALLTAAVHIWLTTGRSVTLQALEFPILIVPLIMAGILLFLFVAGQMLRTEGARPIRGAAWVILIVAMTWSGLVAFLYDYLRHSSVRFSNYMTDIHALSKVPPNSLFVSAFYLGPSLIEGDRIRIAFPGMDQAKDLPRLVAFHLNAGRRVFGAMSIAAWRTLNAGPLKGYSMEPVVVFPGEREFLGEITSEFPQLEP